MTRQAFLRSINATFRPCALAILFSAGALAQSPTPATFIREQAPLIAITHVEVIDGTGAAPQMDQTVLIDHGRIAAIGSDVQVPAGTKTIDGSSKTLIPGLVGMHEHLFYVSPVDPYLTPAGGPIAVEQFFTAPPLYLASGVTTGRTTGAEDPYGDLQIKIRIEHGQMPGPSLDLTTPYLEGAPGAIPDMHELTGPDDARSLIRYWHSLGFTSAKAYMDITPEELKASIDESHKLHMKITCHLCSVGYDEAAEMGIDNLEHGPFGAPDGELYSKKRHGVCGADSPSVTRADVAREIVNNVDPDSPQLKHTVQLMVDRHVALTSTLAVFESGYKLSTDNPRLSARLQKLMDPRVWDHIKAGYTFGQARDAFVRLRLKKEMAFEREFVAAGGLLMTGCDPTGDGHTIAGLGDQRNLELLSEAGFTTPQVIQIATLNGAKYLGMSDLIGSIAKGKQADLVLLDGDLAADISVIEKPEVVFKAGVGYDSQAIYASLRGQQGLH
jgi:hypothetical protein